MRSEDKIQSYQCQVCDRHFSSRNSLKVHLESHEKSKKYQCKDCGALFHTQGSYYGHIRRHSGHPIICHYCGKSFFHKDKFKCHLRTHTGEKPFVCTHCPKKFASRDNLKRHDVLVHKNDNDFSCGICSEKFVFYQNFLDHLKSHKVKKYFKCDICKKMAKSKSLLLRHMRVHTGKKPYKCDMCPASFSDSSNKKRHMKTYSQHLKLRDNESRAVLPEDISTPKSFFFNLDINNSQNKLYILLKNENLKIVTSQKQPVCDYFSAPVRFVQDGGAETTFISFLSFPSTIMKVVSSLQKLLVFSNVCHHISWRSCSAVSEYQRYSSYESVLLEELSTTDELGQH